EVLELVSELDAALAAIPEVDRAVGKVGRADSALDPAPVSMIETLVTYVPEYRTAPDGTRVRQWRDHIRSTDDLWDEIVATARIPGLTSAPLLMPIQARLVMLQSGMRAPLGVRVKGPSLEALDAFGHDLETVLREVPAIRAETVFADRVVGKPYLEIDLDREAIGRYGLTVVDVQRTLQLALGGVTLTRTVEGRARYPVRVRTTREDRDSVEALEHLLVPTPMGEHVPLTQLAEVLYVRGPQMIRSEDTFLTSYVLFDRVPDVSEVDVVAQARAHLARRLDDGTLVLPDGVSFEFAGSYEHQVRSEQRLAVLVPAALALVFVLLHLQFRSVVTTAIVGSGVMVAVGGAFVLLWLYAQPWFLHLTVLGTPLQDLFQVGPVDMTVAVWVGVLALVGLATDDGVVMATYLDQSFAREAPASVEAVRDATLAAGVRRVRPCLMTTATTLLALLPVVTSQGRGADVMGPIALPLLGGMALELLTLFVVPVLYSAAAEWRVR
ncbi:MAG: efflux RND transporter permease subunit, partial [Myxococcales bacterium]|nr:efflux RND transporter permease subunit [Myxococcales bacterium]